jgi:hypothetical protein
LLFKQVLSNFLDMHGRCQVLPKKACYFRFSIYTMSESHCSAQIPSDLFAEVNSFFFNYWNWDLF